MDHTALQIVDGYNMSFDCISFSYSIAIFVFVGGYWIDTYVFGGSCRLTTFTLYRDAGLYIHQYNKTYPTTFMQVINIIIVSIISSMNYLCVSWIWLRSPYSTSLPMIVNPAGIGYRYNSSSQNPSNQGTNSPSYPTGCCSLPSPNTKMGSAPISDNRL